MFSSSVLPPEWRLSAKWKSAHFIATSWMAEGRFCLQCGM